MNDHTLCTVSRLFDGAKASAKLHREHSEFLSHTSTPMRIEAIQFSLLSERDVTRLSEVELTQKLLYSPDDRTLPAENGPLDRRLGVSARNALCATCGAALADCAGHFGRIELCLPVFHVGYFNAVKALLERICKCCSRILLAETERSQLLANVNSADAHLRAAARRDAHKLAKRSKWRCHWCAAYNGPVKKVTGMLKLLHERFAKPNKAAEHAIASRDVDFVASGKFELSTLPPFVEFSEAVANHSELSLLVHKAAEDLNPLHVHQLLSRIEDDDCLLLGLNPAKARPELLMLTSLIVPPVCLRPSLSRDPSSGTTEDDLTVQLSSIIHYNELIKKQLNLVHGATTREALIAGATSGGAATMAAVAAAAASSSSSSAAAMAAAAAAVSSSSSTSLLAAPGGGLGGAGSADAAAAAAKAPSLATVQGQWSHLQCIVAQYINSDMPGVSKATFSSTTYRRSLCQRLKGKQGRFRGNLSGKRVDFSGRTVISPDPNLHVEEVGIPTDVAKIMTYPERVFNKNIDYLRELVRRGADEWPGATHVRNEQGDRALRFADRERTAQHLKPGDIVMRHMRHGDILLFNRQPSLHRVSIMAFKARVMAGRTFRFNECACVSFNADFDGDEMNIHLPQTEEARAESRELMSVVCNLVTPRTGDILVAATQDFLSCSFLLSKRDRFFTRAQMMQLCWHMMGVEGARDAAVTVHLPQPTILRPKQLWTGKQMVELILCPTRADRARVSINLFAKTKMMKKRPAGDTEPWMCPHDGCLIIRDSQLLSGWLEKSVLGSSGQKNNLFHALLRDVDAATAALCMTRLARLCARTIGEFGFTFGIEDVTASPALLAQKAALIKLGYEKCDETIREYRENRLAAQAGCSIEETLESRLTGELGSLRQRAGELCTESLPAHNAPLIMSQCGSKGSLINISQMIAIVGQQQVGGARIQDGFERRTLPHFARNSREPAAKGFVANSFQSGLTPTEFFFHTMGGREGLVDTAVKSVTGDTLVYVTRGGGAVQCVRIGDWIDSELAVEGRAVERHGAEQRNLELLPLAADAAVYMPTVDAAGAVTWGAVTALTRHDPGEVLYRMRTRGGRDVTVTASKSVLVYDEQSGAIHEIEPARLVPGKSRVPVLASLPPPPCAALTALRVDAHLPKTEYVYGTEFNVAARLAAALDASTCRAPPGWWQSHNGRDFTLPYPSFAHFRRACAQSAGVEDGRVYACRHARRDAALADRFSLTREFGVFCGLYVADGCAFDAGLVRVSSGDAAARQTALQWLADNGIKSACDSQAVVGHSALLACLVKQAFGHGAAHKRLPAEFVGAPLPFVHGLLDGFMSDGSAVSDRGVQFASASLALLHGLQMLAARVGAFGKLTAAVGAARHRLSFRSVFAQRLRQAVAAAPPERELKRARLCTADAPGCFPLLNDVVLDTVESIEEVDVRAHPKVYDVTLPSTLNFGLANGLMVRDTAETGYLQRKMMKSLEDLSVQYDGSVRTSSGNVVQFEYGDDQLDPLCMEQAQNPVDFERQMSRIVAANVNREPNLRPHALQRLAAGWLQWHLQKERNTSSPLFARQVLQYLCGLPPGPGDASAAKSEPYLYAKPGAPPSLLAQLISLRKSLGLPETKAYAMEELHTALGWRVIFAKGATRDDVKHEADKIEALAMAAAGRVEQSHDALDVDRPDNAPVVSPARLDPQLVAACAVDATKEARMRVYAGDFDGDECDAVSVRLLAKLVRITAAQLMTFINVIVKKHQLARIEPGSAVGALAAQSIGEPATQMTLKTCEHGRLARACSRLVV
jgi:DNA-directed RNA polymerase beta' subunit